MVSFLFFPRPHSLRPVVLACFTSALCFFGCVSEDLTGTLTRINKTSSSVCSACLTLPGFLIPFFQPLINSGQSNFAFFHRNFRRESNGSEGGNDSKLGLSASPKGTTTLQSSPELFSPSSRYHFPQQAPQNTHLRPLKPSLKQF